MYHSDTMSPYITSHHITSRHVTSRHVTSPDADAPDARNLFPLPSSLPKRTNQRTTQIRDHNKKRARTENCWGRRAQNVSTAASGFAVVGGASECTRWVTCVLLMLLQTRGKINTLACSKQPVCGGFDIKTSTLGSLLESWYPTNAPHSYGTVLRASSFT